jgi:hypothetical protein
MRKAGITKNGQWRKERDPYGGPEHLAKIWTTIISDWRKAKEEKQRAVEAMFAAGQRNRGLRSE